MPWKFGISFGLVNFPVKLHGTIKEEKISFNMITPEGNRVRQRLVDEKTGEEISRGETKKGYEVSKGTYVVLEQGEISSLKLKSTKTVEVIGFVSATTKQGRPVVDPIIQKEHFYVSPETGGEKGYSILFNALKELNIMAVGRTVFGGKEYTVTMAAWKTQLLLTVLHYPSEVQLPPAFELVAASDRELELGKQLISALGNPEIGLLKDRYVEAIKELIQAKMEGKEIKPIEVQETAEMDIAAALEKSLGSITKKKKPVGVAVSVQGTAEMVET